jgi:stearoyl-CoA desaturase (delta-9 desaturase)
MISLMFDSALDFLANGLTRAGLGTRLIFLLAMTQVTVLTVSLYLHRSQTHRAVDFHPALAHFFRFWSWLTTAMVTREWVAVHRKHHAFAEATDDPHSPHIHGISRVLLRGSELYFDARRDASVQARYGRGTPDDWLERHVYSVHSNWGPTLMAVIDIALFGVAGMAIWAVQMMWIPFWAAGVVNGVGHWFGYRNFETPDRSANIVPWAFWVGGEELHNNHHAFPSSATFAIRPFEFDLGWLVIRGLARLKLATVLRLAPKDALQPALAAPDMAPATLLATHRVQLMTAYVREVIMPTLSACSDALGDRRRGLPRQLRRALANGGRWLDKGEHDLLEAWIRTRPALHTVYVFREKLDALARTRHTTALVDGVRCWIHDAERSGVEALQAFAARLEQRSA